MKEALLDSALAEMREGMELPKCLKCGCMRDALELLSESLPSLDLADRDAVVAELDAWLSELEEQKYSCAGCSHCFGAVAANILHDITDEATTAASGVSGVVSGVWPPLPGEYTVLGDGPRAPVAISTLGSEPLADEISAARPFGVAIVGKTETENIGIDKLVGNTVSNPSLRFLVLAGQEPEGHRTGQTLLALAANGVDERMRIIGAEGRRPLLRNTTPEEVERFRQQVEIIDMIGTFDVDVIIDKTMELSLSDTGCSTCSPRAETPSVHVPERIVADENVSDQLDKAGYFVIFPQPDEGKIVVEHYGNDDRLLHVVEGKDARSIYFTAIKGGWLTQLSHAAYLGRELEKAELSMAYGFKYVQDGM